MAKDISFEIKVPDVYAVQPGIHNSEMLYAKINI